MRIIQAVQKAREVYTIYTSTRKVMKLIALVRAVYDNMEQGDQEKKYESAVKWVEELTSTPWIAKRLSEFQEWPEVKTPQSWDILMERVKLFDDMEEKNLFQNKNFFNEMSEEEAIPLKNFLVEELYKYYSKKRVPIEALLTFNELNKIE
jgi:hypothetical protein